MSHRAPPAWVPTLILLVVCLGSMAASVVYVRVVPFPILGCQAMNPLYCFEGTVVWMLGLLLTILAWLLACRYALTLYLWARTRWGNRGPYPSGQNQ
jgi:hypothetical protein